MNLQDMLSPVSLNHIRRYTNANTVDDLRNYIYTCSDTIYREIMNGLSVEAKYILNKMRHPHMTDVGRITTNDRIYYKLYHNLRNCFYENCVIPILGESYNNNKVANVSANDQITTEDIKRTYLNVKNDRDLFGIAFLVSFFINVIFIAMYLLQ